jgi:hypothetical protein
VGRPTNHNAEVPAGRQSPIATLGETPQADLAQTLRVASAAKREAFLSHEQCRSAAAKLGELRPLWSRDYDGEQFSYPDNFYARANDGGVSRYFSRAADANDAMVEHFSEARSLLLAYLGRLLPGREVRVRPGWLGPAFVIFPAGEFLSREPGPVHIDLEGLAEMDLQSGETTFFSVICMIQPPDEGGGVRVWNRCFGGDRSFEDQFLDQAKAEPEAAVELAYQVGDLFAINSLSPHQILQFGGARDRITLNAFAAADSRSCNVWF